MPSNASTDELIELDQLINARWVIPVEPYGTVLDHHAIGIRDGEIVAVMPQDKARSRCRARETVELPEHVVLPGLINLHTHAAMTLMRGLADDLPLMQWLEQAIWPVEGKHGSAAFVRDGTLLAAAEMLRGGITTCNEMYFHPDAAAAAFDEAGMRAVLGVTVLDFPTPYAADADEYLRKGLDARDKWHTNPLLNFAIAPHAPYTVSDATLDRANALAAELDCPMHIHVHETAHEIDESVKRFGMRPLARLAGLDMLGENFIGVHAVHLDDTDMELLTRHGCSIAHCPSSNMKLASGIAPVRDMLAAGLRVGLGTDGAASNNRLDLFEEMREAAMLAKVATLDATAVPAHTAIRMATLDGADALGMKSRIGSVVEGKRADLCAVDLSALENQPCYDPASHLVYVAGRQHVSHVWVDGCLRLRDGELMLQNSNNELIAVSRLWQTKLKS